MIYILFFLLVTWSNLNAQPNCEAFKYYGDTTKYNACKVLEKLDGHYQFSKEFQEVLDESIAIDSSFAYAYREKSVAYLKSGDFITWKQLMDKAVYYDLKDNLGYRAACRYDFFKDYKGAIEDIELLEKSVNYNLGHSPNGDYHLIIIKGLCYRAIGQELKGLRIIESKIQEEGYRPGIYDYLHLGVLYFNQGEYEKAIETFELQHERNDIAESHYYAAFAYSKLNSQQEKIRELEESKRLYLEGYKLQESYIHYPDKIYLEDIEAALGIKE
jgi:tetratricopeptide (TPR) repeat protein